MSIVLYKMETFKILCKAYELEGLEFAKYNAMLQKAEEEITVKMMKDHMKNEIQLGRGSKAQNMLYKDLQAQAIELKNALAKKSHNGYMFITINPKPSVEFEDFRKFMAKICMKTCFEQYLYVFEQRSESPAEQGKGFHAHMLVKRNLKYKPIKLKQNLQNSCKKIVGNVHNNNQLNLQIIGEQFAKDKCEYMLGMNKDIEKKDKQMVDQMWRSDLGICSHYNSSEKIMLI